eukprot:gnl/MRDRNA2_/MRDRNA2_82592_c0_seq2.p1 gnl/MRDRNA2_/MRDRNA2_82592_c0~~gnl/MRDRNA2_/MRDRNA2_82592_c0_seq2.p1  ORF type:complete len:716 (+),score=166.24 gnl/MRDRNA2_/MRDRNA2_82592_c0_seq2:129-2150(+)
MADEEAEQRFKEMDTTDGGLLWSDAKKCLLQFAQKQDAHNVLPQTQGGSQIEFEPHSQNHNSTGGLEHDYLLTSIEDFTKQDDQTSHGASSKADAQQSVTDSVAEKENAPAAMEELASFQQVRSSVQDSLDNSMWMQNALVSHVAPPKRERVELPIPNADDACELRGGIKGKCSGAKSKFRPGRYCYKDTGLFKKLAIFSSGFSKKAKDNSCLLKPRYYPDRVLLNALAKEEAEMIMNVLDFAVGSGPFLITKLSDLHESMKKVSDFKIAAMSQAEEGLAIPDNRAAVMRLINSYQNDHFAQHLEVLYDSVEAMTAENLKAKIIILEERFLELSTSEGSYSRSKAFPTFMKDVWDKWHEQNDADKLTANDVIGKLIDFGCEGSRWTKKLRENFKTADGKGSIGKILIVGPEYLKYKELAVKGNEGPDGPNNQMALQRVMDMSPGLTRQQAQEAEGKGATTKLKTEKGCGSEEEQANPVECEQQAVEKQGHQGGLFGGLFGGAGSSNPSSQLELQNATRKVLAVARKYGWADHNGTEVSEENHKELVHSAFIHMGNHYNHMMSIGNKEAAEQVDKDIEDAFAGPDNWQQKKMMMWFTWFVLGLVCAAACLWSWGTLCFCFYWMAFFFVMLQSISAILEVKKLANLRSDVKAGGVNGGQNSGHQGFDDRRRKWFR